MALGTRQLSSNNVAVATTYVGAGGRNVASTSRTDVERVDFAHHAGLGQENILRYQQDGEVSPDGRRGRDRRGGGNASLWSNELLQASAGTGFTSSSDADLSAATLRQMFLAAMMRCIRCYEENILITSPNTVYPGSVMNFAA